MPLNMIAIFFLVSAAIGGVAWVFLYPILSGERQAERRRETFAAADPQVRKSAVRGGQQKARREQVEEALKELEVRNRKAKSPPISVRITQAGLTWSQRQFMLISAGMGLAFFVVPLFLGAGLLASAGIGFGAALGLPRWLLSFLKKRRET